MYVFQGRLPAEEGVVVLKAIDRMVDQMKEARVAEQKDMTQMPAKKTVDRIVKGTVKESVKKMAKRKRKRKKMADLFQLKHLPPMTPSRTS